MFRHHLKITFRSFQRNKTSFLINLTGLATGLACVVLIFLWVNDELSVDKFHEKDDQLFQVFQNYEFPNGIETDEISPLLLANALEATFPEIETAVNISGKEDSPKGILSLAEKDILATGIFASENYFDAFSIPIIAGNLKPITKDKNSIALSKDLALKLFNSTDIIGKMVAWENESWKADLAVTSVFETPSSNSTHQFDFIMSNQYLWENEHAATWRGDYVETFLVLKEGIDIKAFNDRIAGFLKTQTEHGDKNHSFCTAIFQKVLIWKL